MLTIARLVLSVVAVVGSIADEKAQAQAQAQASAQAQHPGTDAEWAAMKNQEVEYQTMKSQIQSQMPAKTQSTTQTQAMPKGDYLAQVEAKTQAQAVKGRRAQAKYEAQLQQKAQGQARAQAKQAAQAAQAPKGRRSLSTYEAQIQEKAKAQARAMEKAKAQEKAKVLAQVQGIKARALQTQTCSDSCNYRYDGDCDDGGPGSEYAICTVGTDCYDCGDRAAFVGTPSPTSAPIVGGLCIENCTYSSDTDCDDGGEGSEFSICDLGSDCVDCGVRTISDTASPTMAPTAGAPTAPTSGLCIENCTYSSDTDCDDGGEGSEYSLCDLGSDCVDCGVREPPSPTAAPTTESTAFGSDDPDPVGYTPTIDVSEIVAGAPIIIRLFGGVPNELCGLLYSLTGTGSDYVAPAGVASGLSNYLIWRQTLRTDSLGQAQWTVTVPPRAPTVPVWFQVVQEGLASNVYEGLVSAP